jgi:hypothetical protein
VCATHSPILASTPGADIIGVGEHELRRVEWADLQLVDHWRPLPRQTRRLSASHHRPMSAYLAAEPQTDPDAVFRNFQRHNLSTAAAHFNVIITATPSFGWRLRSIGAPAAGQYGACWLRVVSEEPQWARGEGWTGNVDANSITTVAKPRVLDVFDWPERDWRHQRAEVVTLVPGEPCSPSDVLRHEVQGPQHRRTLLQQAQRVPGRRHPIRQARHHLPGHHRRRLDQDLAPQPHPMIQETLPSSRNMRVVSGGRAW